MKDNEIKHDLRYTKEDHEIALRDFEKIFNQYVYKESDVKNKDTSDSLR